ncbi:MAG: hypothetical protein U9R04_04285 [Chloroflexota bacterium]|nr:hypothetical protein [Chloroflexota bacterium]
MGLSNQFYDFILPGAGPVGSYTSCQLASPGYRVAVLEQKGALWFDVCCTGIISTGCFDSFDWHSKLLMAALKYRLAHPWRKARHILPWEANL